MNVPLKIIAVLFIVGIYVLCPMAYAKDEYVSASANISQFIESVSITKKALKVDNGKRKEYDFLLNINVANEKEDAVESIDVTFPNGKKVHITKETQNFPGHEHVAGFAKDAPQEPYNWFYRNIAVPNLNDYGEGTYEFLINHVSGTEEFKIKFLNPATGKALPVPEFGKLLAPEEDSEVTSPVIVKVGDHKKPVGLYFRSRDPKDGGLVEKEFTIPIGTNQSEPIELAPGSWGAELMCSENVSGKINGVTWQLDVGTTYEYKFNVKSSGKKLGKIAFSSERDGNSEIYVMDADGSNQTRLTSNDVEDSFPYWSPDGSRILFQSSKTEDSPAQLYTMNPDGSDVKQLTKSSHRYSSPSWSPDGKSIAFHYAGNVYVIDADGSNERQVTDLPGHSFLSPTWSPDSKKIAAEGGDTSKKIQTQWGEASPMQIWIFAVEGSSPPVQATDIKGYNGYPAWSPKGDAIAFDSTEDGWADIAAVNPRTKKVVNLTQHNTECEFAAWSADGSKIAFVAGRDGNNEIYIMNADGSDQTRLTVNDAVDTAPAWSPLGN